jgi:hypothetical protein
LPWKPRRFTIAALLWHREEGDAMKGFHAVLAAFAALACGQAMACYTVYDRDNVIIYNDLRPPVDMSQPLHESLAKRFKPGASMVFNESPDCPSEARLQVRSVNGKSPLLTDQKTAEEMKLPHKPLGNGMAVISERPDTMRPGVVLAESGLPREEDTRAMGAGPAKVQGAQPAGVVPQQQRRPVQKQDQQRR